ncbi:MAG: hypothetical protein Q7S37_01805 [bacterium]|nr:hypothetical protein [bacterium]
MPEDEYSLKNLFDQMPNPDQATPTEKDKNFYLKPPNPASNLLKTKRQLTRIHNQTYNTAEPLCDDELARVKDEYGKLTAEYQETVRKIFDDLTSNNLSPTEYIDDINKDIEVTQESLEATQREADELKFAATEGQVDTRKHDQWERTRLKVMDYQDLLEGLSLLREEINHHKRD